MPTHPTHSPQTWRPGEFYPGCVEIYSTGKANIPGTKSHDDLLEGFGKLVPRLLEFSSSAEDTNGGEPNFAVQGGTVVTVPEEEYNALESDDDDLWAGWGERED